MNVKQKREEEDEENIKKNINTFRPTIGKKSRELANNNNKAENLEVHERLYNKQ